MYLRVIGFTITLLLLATASIAKPIPLQISRASRVNTQQSLAAGYLLKLITERSQGRVQPVLQSQKLPTERALQALAAGQVQLAILDLPELRQSLPQLRLLELPFLFQNRQHLHRILDGEIGRQILLSGQQQNFTPLSFWDAGFHQLLADRPLTSPELLAGSDRGVSAQRLLFSQIQVSGAAPLTPEAQKHDKRKTPLDILLSQVPADEWPERTDLTLTNHRAFASVLLVEQNFWSQLPEDLRIIISGAIKDATSYSRELTLLQEQQLLEQWQKNGRKIHRLTPAQRQLWHETAVGLYPQYTNARERHLIAMVLQG